MRRISSLAFAFLILTAFGLQAASAQIRIPEIPGIKKPKKELPKQEQPQTNNEQTNRSGQSSGGNDNSDEARTNKAQNEIMQVKPSNVGKIYFSNKPFTTTNEGSKTSFTAGEYIYGRFETGGGTLRDVLKFSPITDENPEHRLNYNLYLYYISKGLIIQPQEAVKAIYNYPFTVLTEADLDKTYWNFDVLPEPAKAATRIYTHVRMMEIESEDGPYALYNYLKNSAEEQTYTVRIELQRQTRDFRGKVEDEGKWLIVEGRATIDFKGTNFAKIKADGDQIEANRVQRYKKAKEEADTAELANEALPSEWTLKSNPLLPGLTESSVKAMFQYNHPYRVQKQIIKLYAEPATSRERTVVPNELGIPKYRYVRQKFTVFVKVVGEDKCFYQRLTPAQEYSGGGTFGDFYALLEGRVNISCAKMGVK